MASLLSSSDARAELKTAQKEREALEAEAEAIEAELTSPSAETGAAGPGLSGPLVDGEGYPRADIDVYRARQLRHRHACLRTDHKALMKRIEALLPLALAPVDAPPPADVAMADARAEAGTPPPADAAPFARVAEVRPGSPAAAAGLREGDLVVAFGGVFALGDVKRWTLTHVNEAFDVVVDRGGARSAVKLAPRAWAGQGLLGCLLVPVTVP